MSNFSAFLVKVRLLIYNYFGFTNLQPTLHEYRRLKLLGACLIVR